MAKGVARVGDPSTVFFTCTPDFAMEGSPDTLVNNRSVHRKTDKWTTHCCPHGNCYFGILLQGAPTHFTNGLNTGRVNDPILRQTRVSGTAPFQAGAARVLSGSLDTFIGGSISVTGDPFFRAGSARAGNRLFTILS